jgi:5S rRNA maturation endonuclease (ribonuclease M5)
VNPVEDFERLEELDKLLVDLAEASLAIPIIVEGKRDTKALRALGIEGTILELNVGKGVVDFCEGVSREHRKVILLTDWDAKGGTLFRALADGLKSLGVNVDGDFRRELARLSKKGAKDVEGVPGFILWLVEQDQAGLKTSIEYRKHVAKLREKRLANGQGNPGEDG